jgi:hypothetical protein
MNLSSVTPVQLLEDQALIGLAQQNRDRFRDTDIHETAVDVKGVQVVLKRSSHKLQTF